MSDDGDIAPIAALDHRATKGPGAGLKLGLGLGATEPEMIVPPGIVEMVEA